MKVWAQYHRLIFCIIYLLWIVHCYTIYLKQLLSASNEIAVMTSFIADSPKVLVDLYFEAKMARQWQRGFPPLLRSPQNSLALQNLSWQ